MVRDIVRSSEFNELIGRFTVQIEKGRAGFPGQVVDELKVLARDEPITRWCIGLGRTLKAYAALNEYVVPVMETVAELGYEEGVENPDGSEPSLIYAAALACRYLQENRTVSVVTEDRGSLPLRPSMETLANELGIDTITTQWALTKLDLDDLLFQG